MNGLISEQKTNRIYLQILDGSLVQKSKIEKEGYEVFKSIDPKKKETHVSWIKRYNGIEAFIDSVEWYSSFLPDGTNLAGWKVFFNADGQNVSLQLPITSVAASRFMKLAENIDYSKPVTVKVWKDPNERTAFLVSQDSQTVKQKYTKDNPNGLPEPKQRATGKWDYQDQMDFLVEVMNDVVIPRIDAAAYARGVQGFNSSREDDSDVPF